jgi:hypothetical protein
VPNDRTSEPSTIELEMAAAADLFDQLGEAMLGEIHPCLARRAAVRCRAALKTASACTPSSLLDASDSLLIAAGGLYVSVSSQDRAWAARLYETALSWRRLVLDDL